MQKIIHILFAIGVIMIIVGILVGAGILLTNNANPIFILAWVFSGIAVLKFLGSFYK